MSPTFSSLSSLFGSRGFYQSGSDSPTSLWKCAEQFPHLQSRSLEGRKLSSADSLSCAIDSGQLLHERDTGADGFSNPREIRLMNMKPKVRDLNICTLLCWRGFIALSIHFIILQSFWIKTVLTKCGGIQAGKQSRGSWICGQCRTWNETLLQSRQTSKNTNKKKCVNALLILLFVIELLNSLFIYSFIYY